MNGKQAFTIFHEHLYQSLINILTDLTDIQLAYSAPQIDTRSICDVAIHSYRPVLAVVYVLSDANWPPRPDLPMTKDQLFHLLDTMHEHIMAAIFDMTEDELERDISLPWKLQQSGIEALVECCAHGLLHIGTIQGIRASGGFPTPVEEPMPRRGSEQN